MWKDKKEFESDLVSKFPRLYVDMYGNQIHTCMAWGICVNKGWWNIIFDLSVKLEKIINQYMDANADVQMCICGHKEEEHVDDICSVKMKFKDIRSDCKCNKFSICYPRASQVKEKFAGLRFYMTVESEGMREVIHDAESKSYNTCEMCGNPGKVRRNGWMLTMCDSCNDRRNDDREEKI